MFDGVRPGGFILNIGEGCSKIIIGVLSKMIAQVFVQDCRVLWA